MKLNRKSTNVLLAGFLVLVVLTIGVFAYQQKASADTILPGFATAHIALRVTIPEAQSVKFRVVFTPTNGTKRYYFKERSFDFASAGLNSVEWYIRKIPEGSFSVVVTSDTKTLLPSPVVSSLVVDKVTDTAKFELNLGTPPASTVTPEASIEATNEATTTATSTTGDLYGADPTPFSENSVVTPPVPQLPTQ